MPDDLHLKAANWRDVALVHQYIVLAVPITDLLGA